MKFLLTILALSGLIVAGSIFLLPVLPSFFTESLLLIMVTTTGLYYFLLNMKKKHPESFIMLYLLTLVIKVVAVGVFLFFAFSIDPQGASANGVFVLISYFLFTLTEVLFLYRKVGGGKTPGQSKNF